MNLNVVLVRTENSSNVGAALRAMLNMGGSRLILIDPKCPINGEARAMAAGAADKLDEIVTYPSWKEFYVREGTGLRIALTRRGGRARKVIPLADSLPEVLPENIYLIFGPEADGLDSEDLALVNGCCHLPVHGEFASLNLAQAVLLACHIVRTKFPVENVRQTTGNEEPAFAPIYFPEALIKRWLTAMGFDIQARRSSAFVTLRRLFMLNQPTRHEYQVLEAVLQQNIRKLGERANQPYV